MFKEIKKQLYFRKMALLCNQGVIDKKIVPFDDDFYEKMSHTYFNGLPISMHIRYLKPLRGMPGGCYDRSLLMFFCFPNALLCRGDNKDLELNYGKGNAGHGWIEIDNYVYDPSLTMRFDKDLYYQIYTPTNVSKSTIEEYCQIKECQEFYDTITKTTICDFLPFGKKRTDLINIIPLIIGIVQMSENEQFKMELENWLSVIQYDEKEINDELNERIRSLII